METSTQNKQNRDGRRKPRVHRSGATLRSIWFRIDGRVRRMLVDAGPDINLMKEDTAQTYRRYTETKKFMMGNNTYTCKEAVRLPNFTSSR